MRSARSCDQDTRWTASDSARETCSGQSPPPPASNADRLAYTASMSVEKSWTRVT